MNRTDVLLRKALKKIDMLENRCNEMEKKLGMIGDYTHLSLDRPEEITRDADGRLLDIHGNEYNPKKSGNNGQHDFAEYDYDLQTGQHSEDDYDWDTAGSL